MLARKDEIRGAVPLSPGLVVPEFVDQLGRQINLAHAGVGFRFLNEQLAARELDVPPSQVG